MNDGSCSKRELRAYIFSLLQYRGQNQIRDISVQIGSARLLQAQAGRLITVNPAHT
jgi:hypothetical protein